MSESERAGPMRNPPHPGELIRESMEEAGWSVTETSAHLGHVAPPSLHEVIDQSLACHDQPGLETLLQNPLYTTPSI